MVTIIDGMQTVRSVCLYSSGISYATVKSRFPPEFMRRASLAGIVQKFSCASRIGEFSFAPALFSGKLCEIDQCFVVRPATLNYWNIDASIYTRLVYIQAGGPLPPRVFFRSGKSLCLPRIPGFGCPELLRPRPRCYN